MSDAKSRALARTNRRTARNLMVVALAMFGFGFALVPLYDVICAVTGLNGKTGVARAETLDGSPDRSRLITVEFVGGVNSALPWEFAPANTSMEVHPGQVYEAFYVAANGADSVMAGQAVPSVSPNRAAPYFKKTECFCFTRQELEPREQRQMPVRFVIAKDLPVDIDRVTLSYTFFRAADSS